MSSTLTCKYVLDCQLSANTLCVSCPSKKAKFHYAKQLASMTAHICRRRIPTTACLVF